MNLVYTKISIELIDDLKGVFRKLKRYVGEYRIEGQDLYDYGKAIKISFWTDKVKIKEGEDRTVFLSAKSNKKGSWYFTGIEK